MSDALIITDGRFGNLRQARALARAAGFSADEVVSDLRAPWSKLAPRLPGLAGIAQRDARRLPTRPPWPRLVIGCGRQAAWITRWLRRQAGDASYCVQILDPRINSKHWDLLITPRHDGVRGDNVITPIGSLNPVDAAWLSAARSDFPHLSELPQPRVTLLLGGPRRGVAFDAALLDALVQGISAHLENGAGSVLLCASPRTPPAFAASLRDALRSSLGDAWLGEADGPNPYPGHLAWADRIVVTPDSVNMLSEAAASGAPVHSLSQALPSRLARFHAALREGGWLNDLGHQAPAAEQPLRETRGVARTMLERMQAAAANA